MVILLHGRYRVEEEIASGGMGAVFAATDERLERRVAVKILREDLAHDPKFVERFRREARAVAALAHPNIANVFDYGEEGGRHFIVMELVEGRNLASVIAREGRLDPGRVVRIAEQICDALGHAHAAGVVHRDVKPANVIVGEQDLVKVTDFGIARAVGDSTLTATGSLLGSASYISPEQANGDPATPASDLYSLGIVVYEMLTGTVPFTGESAVGVALRHVTGEVPPPSASNPEVPPALDAVLARATARAPEDRWPNAAGMAAALQASLTGTGVGPPVEIAAAGTDKLERDPRQTVWPIPGDRWDPNRIGRVVAIVFGALLLTALVLLVARVTAKDTSPPARAAGDNRRQRPATARSSSPTPTAPTVPNLVGDRYDDAAHALEAAGWVVDRNDQASEDVEKDVVIAMDPPAGSAVLDGETITLTVSTGEEGKPAPPGHGGKLPPGLAKKKPKDKDKDD